MNALGAVNRGSTLRLGFAGVAFVAAATLITGTRAKPAVAQPQVSNDTLSAPMLRRLAEAADALRDGKVKWMLVDTAPPFNVAGVYGTADSAFDSVLIARGFRVRGPFRTPPDFGMPHEVFVTCTHTTRPNPSAYGICPSRPIRLHSIRGLDLVIRTATDTINIPLRADEVDALFFSVSAFDKFVAPYYTRLYGPRFAQQLRDEMAELVRSAR